MLILKNVSRRQQNNEVCNEFTFDLISNVFHPFIQVMQAFAQAESKKKPNPEYLFTDVYKEMPTHINKQLKNMKEHVATYKEHYPVDTFDWKVWTSQPWP